MISKAKLKYVKSLQLKKYRKQEQCFPVEGAKSVSELLQSDFKIKWLAATPEFIGSMRKRPSGDVELIEVSEKELEQMGAFQTNESAIAVAEMKPDKMPVLKDDEIALVLDDLRDPGNLGTIIRTADWYGIVNIIASPETAEFYNPKVISASMGSFCRVNVYYTSLQEFLRTSGRPVYGAFLSGKSIYETEFKSGSLLVVGNESNGISDAVARFVSHRVTIPRRGGAESLNAGIAAGIMLDNVFRSKK